MKLAPVSHRVICTHCGKKAFRVRGDNGYRPCSQCQEPVIRLWPRLAGRNQQPRGAK
jgi:hypothetical protein